MDSTELTRAINRRRNLLLVEGRSLSDPEYQDLLAQREALNNPAAVRAAQVDAVVADVVAAAKPKKPTSKKKK